MLSDAAATALLNILPYLLITAALVVMSQTATVPMAPPAATSQGASGQKAAPKTAPTSRSCDAINDGCWDETSQSLTCSHYEFQL